MRTDKKRSLVKWGSIYDIRLPKTLMELLGYKSNIKLIIEKKKE